MQDSKQIPVRFIATTPKGAIQISAEDTETGLPVGPQDSNAKSDLRFGPYLEAVCHLLLRNNCQKIVEALASRLGSAIGLEDIHWLEIRTEKHGAFYHVARADFSVAGEILYFVVNVAASEEARTQLERDFRLLKKLEGKYRFPYLPQAYFKGAGHYREAGKAARWLHMYVAEWFKGFHEFHLHLDRRDSSYNMLLWDLDNGSRYLPRQQCRELYRQAGRILTTYYNYNSFKQIHPWHHAAGDFVVKEQEGQVDLRLVTVRDYARVVKFKTSKREGKLLALILFFLHLTIQMRLDRLDGVGDVIWADDYCLEGVVAGFFEGLEQGNERCRQGMPSVTEIQDLLRRFSKDEWVQMLVECLGTYKFSKEELSHIRNQGDAHIAYLKQVLATFG